MTATSLNFVLLDLPGLTLRSWWSPCCKPVTQSDVARGRIRKSRQANIGGPTCLRTLALEIEGAAPN